MIKNTKLEFSAKEAKLLLRAVDAAATEYARAVQTTSRLVLKSKSPRTRGAFFCLEFQNPHKDHMVLERPVYWHGICVPENWPEICGA
jgi:hypothetical protein